MSSNKSTPISFKYKCLESYFAKQAKGSDQQLQQMWLWGNAIDPSAGSHINIAIADFVHSHLLPFSIAEDPKLMKIIDEARNLGGSYFPVNRRRVSGTLLDGLYDDNWKDQMKTITLEANIFGVSIFGDGTTIKLGGFGTPESVTGAVRDQISYRLQ